MNSQFKLYKLNPSSKILESKLYLGVLPIITTSLTPEEIALMTAVRKIVCATIFITPAAKSELFGSNEKPFPKFTALEFFGRLPIGPETTSERI